MVQTNHRVLPRQRSAIEPAFRHGAVALQPISDEHWGALLVSIGSLPLLGEAGQLGEPPGPRFRGAPLGAFQVNLTPGCMTVSGRGTWCPPGQTSLLSLAGHGPNSSLRISRWMRPGDVATCCTGGRPYDGAVRLTLLLLAAETWGGVQIQSTASAEVWAETAALASDLLDREVLPPCLVGMDATPDTSEIEVVSQPGGLWSASWHGATIIPKGPDSARREGHAGFTSREAAYLAGIHFAANQDAPR